jgi:hypothetical protein
MNQDMDADVFNERLEFVNSKLKELTETAKKLKNEF